MLRRWIERRVQLGIFAAIIFLLTFTVVPIH